MSSSSLFRYSFPQGLLTFHAGDPLGELLDPEKVLEYVLVGLEHILSGFARVPHLTQQLSI
jgi:hypothetical protein